jgi:amino acid transporter
MTTQDGNESTARRFGTFGGVFTPVTLTVLGVIMFLRFGQVTGNAGIIHAILIVFLAKAITTLTALSLSAIATNTRVRGGGAYYLISRSLGVEFGSTIGLVFFAAQAIAVALYVIGFAEAFVDAFPAAAPYFRIIATTVNVVIFIAVFVGAAWAIRVQYFILGAVVLSLVSFWIGAIGDFSVRTFMSGLRPAYSDGESFATMFALFFPAVTGIMAGANMSGDLEDPGRSIPRGTLSAIAFTAVVYLSITLIMAGTRSQVVLIGNPLAMKDISIVPWLITLGVFAATLSSGLASMMGAPRILQAVARDNIFHRLRFFAKGSAKTNEPRPAIVITFLISQATILLGDLNMIAPIITMFFLVTYGMINLATFSESITRNPSYRPRFHFSHWITELVGALGCFAVMFLISPMWAVVALMGIGVLYRLIARKQIQARWGDVRHGAAFERARTNLLRLEDERYHPKNWRPVILALSGGAWSRQYLAVYGHWLAGGHGVLTIAQIIVGDVADLLEERHSQEVTLVQFIEKEDLSAFPTVVVAPGVHDGIRTLVQASGIGAIRPNTVLIGWTRGGPLIETFGETLRTIAGLRRSIVVVKTDPGKRIDPWIAPDGTIDVWWRGHKNGTLMLLLAHLLSMSGDWRGRPIRLLRVIPNEDGRAEAQEHLEQLIEVSRIRASAVVIVSPNVYEAIRSASTNAAVAMFGFRTPEPGMEYEFVEGTNRLTDGIETSLLVCSAGGMDLEA